MINNVYELLKPLNIPIKWVKRPRFDTSNIVISYHFFNEGSELYGDGQAIEEGGSLQIDIFSKVDYSSVVKQVKILLTNAGFLMDTVEHDTEETLDDNTSIYHKVLIFNYIESMVK